MKIFSFAILLLFLYPFAYRVVEHQQPIKNNKPAAAKLVFKSADGGQTWQDISEGLPENWRANDFAANAKGLYIGNAKELFHSTANATAPFWKRELAASQHCSIVPFSTATFNNSYNGQFQQTINGASVWSAMYTNFKQKVNSVYETDGGTILISSNQGIFKSVNKGEEWKQVYAGGGVTKLVGSNGVLLATSQNGIIRSTDDAEHWDAVISEGGIGIVIENIKGGFAAINYSKQAHARRVRTSYDGGKTWQAIDAGLKADLSIASIIEVGDNFFCGHPDGIFRSSDKGKTWQLLLPSVGTKVFNLFTSGNVIYAVPKEGGC